MSDPITNLLKSLPPEAYAHFKKVTESFGGKKNQWAGHETVCKALHDALQQYRAARGLPPAPPPINDSEARKLAHIKSRGVLKLYKDLKMIVCRHEEAIRQRWAQMTEDQRHDVVRRAYPEVPQQHRPDFRQWLAHDNGQQLGFYAEKVRLAFLLPAINLEDLAKPATFPILLNARARNHPTKFAAADAHDQALGRNYGVFPALFNVAYAMVLNGVVDDEDYGKVVSMKDNDCAKRPIFEARQFCFDIGIIVLEAQHRLLGYLLDMCKNLLNDASISALMASPVHPEPGPISADMDKGVTRLATLADETPYRCPGTPDWLRLESLLTTQLSSIKDHLWALREDPSYVDQYLRETRNHNSAVHMFEMGFVPPKDAPKKSDIYSECQDNFWSCAWKSLFVDAVNDLELFERLVPLVKTVQELSLTHSDQIDPRNPLPRPYLVAILRLRTYIGIFFNRWAVALAATVQGIAVKTIRDTWPNVKKCKGQDRLEWLMDCFVSSEPEGRTVLGYPLLVDELNHLVQTDAEVREALTPLIMEKIGVLSILGETIRQTELLQPWASRFPVDAAECKADLDNVFEVRAWSAVYLDIMNRPQSFFQGLADPTDGKYEFPVFQRGDKKGIQQRRAAEAKLDKLWDLMDKTVSRASSGFIGLALKAFYDRRHEIQRTAPWVEPAAATAVPGIITTSDLPAVDGRIQSQGLSESSPSPTSGTNHSPPVATMQSQPMPSQQPTLHQHHSHLDLDSPSPRKEILDANNKATPKAKTKGTARPEPAVKKSFTNTTEATAKTAIKVDKKSMKIFRVLFHDAENRTPPGEVPWSHFLYAMTYIGFKPDKVGGSCWQFTPANIDVDHPITFHEPHPRAKIRFWQMRHHGRRLARNFGWDASTFVQVAAQDAAKGGK